MGEEVSRGANLGVILIALAAVIALGFGIFSIAKGTANEGLVQVQDSLGSVGQAQFNDYDQKTITGTQVVAAYKNFQGKPIAVLIGTKAMWSGITSQFTGFTAGTPATGAVIFPAKVDDGDMTPETTDANFTQTNLSGASTQVSFMNYNALLNQAPPSGTKAVALLNGVFYYHAGFQKDAGGNVQTNTITKYMETSGDALFIPTTARFNAHLLKEPTGNILGVVFYQQ